jgi:hypothetical protein
MSQAYEAISTTILKVGNFGTYIAVKTTGFQAFPTAAAVGWVFDR